MFFCTIVAITSDIVESVQSVQGVASTPSPLDHSNDTIVEVGKGGFLDFVPSDRRMQSSLQKLGLDNDAPFLYRLTNSKGGQGLLRTDTPFLNESPPWGLPFGLCTSVSLERCSSGGASGWQNYGRSSETINDMLPMMDQPWVMEVAFGLNSERWSTLINGEYVQLQLVDDEHPLQNSLVPTQIPTEAPSPAFPKRVGGHVKMTASQAEWLMKQSAEVRARMMRPNDFKGKQENQKHAEEKVRESMAGGDGELVQRVLALSKKQKENKDYVKLQRIRKRMREADELVTRRVAERERRRQAVEAAEAEYRVNRKVVKRLRDMRIKRMGELAEEALQTKKKGAYLALLKQESLDGYETRPSRGPAGLENDAAAEDAGIAHLVGNAWTNHVVGDKATGKPGAIEHVSAKAGLTWHHRRRLSTIEAVKAAEAAGAAAASIRITQHGAPVTKAEACLDSSAAAVKAATMQAIGSCAEAKQSGACHFVLPDCPVTCGVCTAAPSLAPTVPTPTPTTMPTVSPSVAPTHAPTYVPTAIPTSAPTSAPIVTKVPTSLPSTAPSPRPTGTPTTQPTNTPGE
jgi:hypothetical protein